MGLDITRELKQLNSRLKAGGTRVTVESRGNSLLLRGTFPPKPKSGKTKPYQQRLFLGFKVSYAGIRAVEQQAKIVSAQLELGTFNWSDWQEDEDNEQHLESVSIWIEKFEFDHWNKVEKNRKSLRTWNDSCIRAFAKFPSLDEPLSLDLILAAIASTNPDTKTRQIVCHSMARLAVFAGIGGVDKIRELTGNYSPKSVNPRNLPSDEEIATAVNSIKHPGWRWLVAMLATYGLRSHEVFTLDMSEFPILRVSSDTKTGERLAYPMYPEWADAWNLSHVVYPPMSQNHDRGRTPGQRIARWFWDSNLNFRAYDLRHAYARRCFEFDIPTNRAAKLMGHSEAMHCNTYRAWIDEKYYRSKFETDVFGEGKPKAPNVQPLE
jgi:integrase